MKLIKSVNGYEAGTEVEAANLDTAGERWSKYLGVSVVYPYAVHVRGEDGELGQPFIVRPEDVDASALDPAANDVTKPGWRFLYPGA